MFVQRGCLYIFQKSNLHCPSVVMIVTLCLQDSESIFLDQNILRAQDKYQDMYKRQEANNSFFTGEESHVLDLRTVPRVVEPPTRVEEPRSTLLEASLPARRDRTTARQVRDVSMPGSSVAETETEEETEVMNEERER